MAGRKRFVAVDTLGLVWALMVVPADTQDRAGGVPLMDRLRAAVKRLKVVWGDTHFDTALTHGWVRWGWVGVIVKKLVGDKGYDGDPQRRACIERDVFPNIPNKVNRVNRWPFDRKVYRGRNRVERLFGKAKQFRRFATRYEKLREMFLGVVHLALGFIRLRRLSNVNTP